MTTQIRLSVSSFVFAAVVFSALIAIAPPVASAVGENESLNVSTRNVARSGGIFSISSSFLRRDAFVGENTSSGADSTDSTTGQNNGTVAEESTPVNVANNGNTNASGGGNNGGATSGNGGNGGRGQDGGTVRSGVTTSFASVINSVNRTVVTITISGR